MVKDKDTEGFEEKVLAEDSFAYFFKNGWDHNVRLMAANVLFIVFNIPAIVLAYLMSVLFIPSLSASLGWDSFIRVVTEEGNSEVSFQLYFLLVIFCITVLVPSLLFTVGPFQAGFAQVYKGIRTNTSESLMSDFKRGIKENWKRSLGAMLIGIVITFIIILSIGFYSGFASITGIVISSVFKILLIAFILVQNFVYNLMAATDLKLGKLYKNALLFIFLRFGPCFAIGLLLIIVYIALPFFLLMSASYLTLGIFIFLYSFVLISWMQYFMSFYTGRLIDRYVSDAKEKSDYSGDNELELKGNEEKEL